LTIIVSFITFQTRGQNISDIVDGIMEPLELSNEQADQMIELMTKYRGEMDKTLAKHEDAEEPDPPKMIADIRDVRDGYRKDLAKLLSKDQNEQYLTMVDGIMTEMFSNIAEIRLMEIQPQFELTNDQVTNLKPVFGKSMLGMIRIIFENADTKLTIPKKIGIANNLKKIQRSTRAGLESTLTSEQLKAYDAWKEEQKGSK